MKATNEFEKAIMTFLDQEKLSDADLAAAMGNEKKTLSSCCGYIMKKVKEKKVNAMTDAEVYGLAKEYYLGAAEAITAPKCKVVMASGATTLAKGKKAEKAEVHINQMSIFDLI